jgi:hypothetical protein
MPSVPHPNPREQLARIAALADPAIDLVEGAPWMAADAQPGLEIGPYPDWFDRRRVKWPLTHLCGGVPARRRDGLAEPSGNGPRAIFPSERRHPNIAPFMDQGGWHKALALKIPDHARIWFPSPSSPPLNPVEQGRNPRKMVRTSGL